MTDTTTADKATAIRKALRRAYNYGQTYWQQADSDLYSVQRKSFATQEMFDAFVTETVAELTTEHVQQAEDGWMPIETAPKDGTEILGDTEEVGALVLYWDTMSQEQEHWSDGMSIRYWNPTRWARIPRRPLPPPPAARAKEGKA